MRVPSPTSYASFPVGGACPSSAGHDDRQTHTRTSAGPDHDRTGHCLTATWVWVATFNGRRPPAAVCVCSSSNRWQNYHNDHPGSSSRASCTQRLRRSAPASSASALSTVLLKHTLCTTATSQLFFPGKISFFVVFTERKDG